MICVLQIWSQIYPSTNLHRAVCCERLSFAYIERLLHWDSFYIYYRKTSSFSAFISRLMKCEHQARMLKLFIVNPSRQAFPSVLTSRLLKIVCITKPFCKEAKEPSAADVCSPFTYLCRVKYFNFIYLQTMSATCFALVWKCRNKILN